MNYATAEAREKYRIAAENPEKLTINAISQNAIKMTRCSSWPILGPAQTLADELQAPLLTGRTRRHSEKLYEQFRRGEIKRLVVSKLPILH